MAIEIPRITCIRCKHPYYPRKPIRNDEDRKKATCPGCTMNPFYKGPGKGWRQGLKGGWEKK